MQPPLKMRSTLAALAVLLAATPASASVVTLANDSTNEPALRVEGS